jgi:predicted deacetylase
LARMARRVLVSVHDVAPAWVEEVRWLLRELDAIGARPRSLLVIPCHNGRDDLRRCPELVELLQVEVANGSEIVLHGYTHARAGRWRGDPLTVARAALFAREVAEFVSLEWQEQRARLLAGREILEELGLPTRGFCPPGWLHTAELPDLLRELGFTYLVEMLFLLDVQLRRRLVTPWMDSWGRAASTRNSPSWGRTCWHPGERERGWCRSSCIPKVRHALRFASESCGNWRRNSREEEFP